jgi:hypothetical protein
MGLLYYGHVDLYLITSSSDTSRYSVGINAIDGSSPRHELNAHDSLYWYFILGWHNFARANTLPYSPGEFELFGSYYLTIKDSVNNAYSNATIEAKAVKFRVTEDVDAGLETQIHDEWMSLTREYLWWGERFKQTWTREDYNELCKQYAELNLPFAIYAHYFYCKSTKDEQEMKKFLKRYVDGPLPELIQFYLNHSDAQKKYPQNLLAR